MLKFVIFELYLLVIIKFIISSGEEVQSSQNVCRTKECEKSANHLARSMKKSADPCKNFYEYACGNFKEYTKDMHEEDEAFSFISQASASYSEKVSVLLKSNITESDPEVIKKVKTMYKTCIDEDAMDKRGLEPLKELLKRLGLTPTTPFVNYNKNYDWIPAAVQLKKILFTDFIFAINVLPDPTNRSVNHITIRKPQSEILSWQGSKSNLVNDKSRNEASEKLEEKLFNGGILSYAGAVSKVMDEGSDIKNSTNYSELLKKGAIMLSKLVSEEKDMHSDEPSIEFPIPKQVTLKELQEMTDAIDDGSYGKPSLNWTRYLNLLFKDVENVTLETENGTEKIILYNEYYIKNAIKFVARRNKYFEIILWWSAFFQISGYSTKELRYLKSNFTGSADNISSDCIDTISEYFAEALAYPFVTEKTEKNKKEVLEMVNYLKHVFGGLVNMSTWMDNETKSRALEKIKLMRGYVSHPPWLNSATELDKRYEGLIVDDRDFFVTLLYLNKEVVKSSFELLRQINDLKESTDLGDPLLVNAYYDLSSNSITVPMGILQFPFYEHPLHVLNYGTLGTILGHEITHGLDNDGKYHDAIGNIREWWQNETLTEYRTRAQCFIDTYSDVNVLFGLKIDGEVTLGENIADNGGFRQSLLAYKRYLEFKGPEPLLPGFENFTAEQLFTLAYANLWCEYSTFSSLIYDLAGTHSPNSARVNEPLKNSKEFAKVWNCEVGSAMNPAKKCKLW